MRRGELELSQKVERRREAGREGGRSLGRIRPPLSIICRRLRKYGLMFGSARPKKKKCIISKVMACVAVILP